MNTNRWYQSTVGVLVAAVLFTVLIFVVAFIILTLRYTWLIKHGQGDKIAAKVQNAFSSLANASGVAIKPVNRADLEVSTLPALGNPNAPVTIVEFVDFKCPNCKVEAPILQSVVNKYSQEVKVLVRHFPIESLHPGASRLSLFAECANEQKLFWATYNLLYARQETISSSLDDSEINDLSQTLLLDSAKIKSCMQSQSTMTTVSRDYSAALQYGVRGTPTFFVNGQKLEGVVSFDSWKQIIESIR